MGGEVLPGAALRVAGDLPPARDRSLELGQGALERQLSGRRHRLDVYGGTARLLDLERAADRWAALGSVFVADRGPGDGWFYDERVERGLQTGHHARARRLTGGAHPELDPH